MELMDELVKNGDTYMMESLRTQMGFTESVMDIINHTVTEA